MKKLFFTAFVLVLGCLVLSVADAYAMHIMEGFLPVKHSVFWGIVSLPFVVYGLYRINRSLNEHPENRMLLGVAAAFTFVMSALKMPSVTGSCSHPTGTGMGAIIFGAAAMAPIGLVVLLFQAILLAHGGLTTVGANLFSMAIAGPFVAAFVYQIIRKLKLPFGFCVFSASALADLVTYITTSLQLAWAFPDPAGGIYGAFIKFAGIFTITQIPLAISEGFLTMLIFNMLLKYNQKELITMRVLEAKEETI